MSSTEELKGAADVTPVASVVDMKDLKQSFETSPVVHEGQGRVDYPGRRGDAIAFGVLALLAQLAFIALYSGCVKYGPEAKVNAAGEFEGEDLHIYTYFTDVHVMVFVGFGFLMTFLKKYGYGAIGLNFFLSALVIQWAILNNGFWNCVKAGEWRRIPMNMEAAVEGDFAAASVMITFGAIIGKATPLQLLIVALCEVMCYAVNKILLERYLKATDIGGTMVIHTFGAYFGLAVSRALHSKKDVKADDSAPTYTTDLFSMIGTVFLWMYWPSFNSALAKTGSMQDRALFNTLISLCAACVTATALSALLRHENKIEMIDVQNATLAGGVAIGSSANLGIYMQGAMSVGMLAGAISVLGYRYVQPFLERAIGLHDTCGVNNLHGMPGLFGATVTAIVAGSARHSLYGDQTAVVYVGREDGRSALTQGAYQYAALCMTFGIAVFSGAVVGLLVRLLNRKEQPKFQDAAHWQLPA
eukprot:m51a1_g4721 putative ammonium transporter rh type c (472) ;mRNA; f:321828-323475